MRRRALAAAVVGTLIVIATFAAPAAGTDYPLVKKWTLFTTSLEGAPNGDVYVEGNLADGLADVYDPLGALRFSFAVTPPAEVRTAYAEDFAFDSSGVVYVDSGLHISKYTSAGAFIATLPGPPTSFNGPYSMAADAAGNLYLLGNDGSRGCGYCVLKLSPGGAILAQWETFASDRPTSIAVDAKGFVYVGGTDDGVIRKFTGAGSFVTSWGVDDSGQIEAGPNGSIYVHSGNEVREFSSSGALIGRFAVENSGGGGELAVGATGLIYAKVRDPDDGEYYVLVHRPQPSPPKIKKGDGRTRKRKMSIRFRGAGVVRFECRLTGQGVPKKAKRWRTCKSPKRYEGLRPGRKVFQVRGISSGGIRGKPAAKKWVIVP